MASTPSNSTPTGPKDPNLSQNSHSYSMDRIRLESIEKRKQECSQIIKERKRKLSELYCVARLPFVPISGDHVQHIEDKLMSFLEKNDLENGHTFDISFLSKEKIFRKSLSPQQQQNDQHPNKLNALSPDSQRSNSQPLEPAKKLRKIQSSNESTPCPPTSREVKIKPKARTKSPSPVQESEKTIPTKKILPFSSTIESEIDIEKTSQHKPNEIYSEVMEKENNEVKGLGYDNAATKPVESIENIEKLDSNMITDSKEGTVDQIDKELLETNKAQTDSDKIIKETEAAAAILTESNPHKERDVDTSEEKSTDNNDNNEKVINKEVSLKSEIELYQDTQNNKESIAAEEGNTNLKENDMQQKKNHLPHEGQAMKEESLEVEKPLRVRKPTDAINPPSLSSIIASYAKPVELKRTDEYSNRDLDYKNLDIKKLMITLMPERKPHKVAEARSLTELYYQQQTLQLQKLLLRAHKTLTTEAFETSLVEGKVSVLHSRIEELKRKNSWSLRQPRKFVDPFLRFGKKTHWDNLISEAKWLATDFKEERRYKISQCVYISQAIRDYWTYGKVCCINRAKIIHIDDKIGGKSDNDIESIPIESNENIIENSTMDIDEIGDAAEEPKELQIEKEKENKEEAEEIETIEVNDAEVKDAEVEDVVVKNVDVKDTEVIDAEVAEIIEDREPEEGTTVEEVKNNTDNLGQMEIDAPPPSVFITDEVPEKNLPEFTYPEYEEEIKDRCIPFNVYSDYNAFSITEKAVINNLTFYSPFDDKESDHLIERELYGHVSAMLPPHDEEAEFEKILYRKIDDFEKKSFVSQKGLFGPFRRVNILKPPRPPPINQLNIRIPTIWLPQDDKYLIKYVSEFSFNWDVISAHLAATPTRSYVSNIERRTAWQCFERYIQLNDKFQFTDMRGMYALASKEWLESAHQVQATTKRRISPLGVGIDSIQRGNRRLRWASMFDAMRKLMKKRELQQKPTPQPRKPNTEVKKSDTPTPEDLSKLKNDRDRALQETYAQQGRNIALQRMRGQTTGRQLSNDVKISDSKMSNALASPQSNPNRNMVRPTTPNGSQMTPEQVQKYLEIQKQRQLAQRQKAMQKQIQGNDQIKPGIQSIQQPPLTSTTLQPNLSTYQSPAPLLSHSTSAIPQIPQSQRLTQSNSYSHSMTSSPQTQFANLSASSQGGSVPTPEQVLQGVKSSSSPPVAPSKGSSSSSPNMIKKQGNSKVTLSPAQISAIVNQIQVQNPKLEKSQVTQLASSYIAKLQVKQLQYEKQQQMSSVGSPQPSKGSPSPGPGPSSGAQPTEKKSANSLTLEQLNALIKNPKLNDQQRKHLMIIRQRQLDNQQRLQAQARAQAQAKAQAQAQTQAQLQAQAHAQLQAQAQIQLQAQAQAQAQAQLQAHAQAQAQLQAHAQAQVQLQAQTPAQVQAQGGSGNGSGNGNRMNSSSITTRFSPQPGSSGNNNMLNYYSKSGNPNGSENENEINANVNDGDFGDLSKIDELFGLNNDANTNGNGNNSN